MIANNLLKTRPVKWFFHRYFNVPENKEIFGIGKNFIDYWEDKEKGIAKRHDYGQPLMRINPWVGLLSEPERGATDTASTNNKDAYVQDAAPTTNFGTDVRLYAGTYSAPTKIFHSFIHFTLSSGSGTISAVTLNLYNESGLGTATIQVHELTQTGWVEGEVTWNIYSTGNNWTVAGGDYDATVVDSLSPTINQYNAWDLGLGATNPISGLTWESEVHLMLRRTTEDVSRNYDTFWSKDNASDKPYIEITYTPAVAVPRHGFVNFQVPGIV